MLIYFVLPTHTRVENNNTNMSDTTPSISPDVVCPGSVQSFGTSLQPPPKLLTPPAQHPAPLSYHHQGQVSWEVPFYTLDSA